MAVAYGKPPGAGGQDASGPDLEQIDRFRSAGIPPARDTLASAKVVSRSRGYLPHIDAPGLAQHIVFRLADSLPAQVRADIAKSRPDPRLAAINAALDAGHGGCELARPDLAALMQTALMAFDRERYTAIAWCVMPNHVHVLATILPGYTLDRVVHSWKSYTAKQANHRLGRRGRFWALEYFDRFMRDERHLARTAAYIEGNPVRAGLCQNVDEWPFSSAWRGRGRRDACGP